MNKIAIRQGVGGHTSTEQPTSSVSTRASITMSESERKKKDISSSNKENSVTGQMGHNFNQSDAGADCGAGSAGHETGLPARNAGKRRGLSLPADRLLKLPLDKLLKIAMDREYIHGIDMGQQNQPPASSREFPKDPRNFVGAHITRNALTERATSKRTQKHSRMVWVSDVDSQSESESQWHTSQRPPLASKPLDAQWQNGHQHTFATASRPPLAQQNKANTSAHVPHGRSGEELQPHVKGRSRKLRQKKPCDDHVAANSNSRGGTFAGQWHGISCQSEAHLVQQHQQQQDLGKVYPVMIMCEDDPGGLWEDMQD